MGSPDDAHKIRYTTEEPRFCLYCNTYYDDVMADRYHAHHPKSCQAKDHVKMGVHRLQHKTYLSKSHWLEILKYRTFLYKVHVLFQRLKLDEKAKIYTVKELLKKNCIPSCILSRRHASRASYIYDGIMTNFNLAKLDYLGRLLHDLRHNSNCYAEDETGLKQQTRLHRSILTPTTTAPPNMNYHGAPANQICDAFTQYLKTMDDPHTATSLGKFKDRREVNTTIDLVISLYTKYKITYRIGGNYVPWRQVPDLVNDLTNMDVADTLKDVERVILDVATQQQ